MGLEQQSDVLGKWYYAAERMSDNGDRLVDLCEQTGLIIASTFKRNHRRHQLTWQGSTTFWRGTFLSQISENLELFGTSRSTLTTVQFFSASRYGSTSETEEFFFNRKSTMNAEENSANVCPFMLEYGPGRSLAMRIPSQSAFRTTRETLPVLLPRKKFAFASAETKSTYNSVCVARSAGDFNQEKRLRRKLRRQLQQDPDNEWTSRAVEFEKVWEDRNPRKAYALLKQYSGKMKRCSPVLNTANGVAVGETTLPIWKEHFKTLLNRLAPSAPELEHVHRPTHAVNEEPPTVSEVQICIQKMKNGKSGGDDGISAEMLKYLPPSGIREMTKIIRSIWIDGRIPDSWGHAIIIPLHKKLSVTDPRNYRGISLLRVMYKVPEVLAFVLADLRLTRCSWQRYSKPMQLAFLDFEAAFDSPHRGRLLNALSADGVPGKFVRLLDDMNQRTTAAVRTPVGCTTPFEVVTGVRQGAVAGPFLFNFAIDDIMRRIVDQCPADIVLASSGCPLTDLEYADDVVIFAESSTKLQHVVSLVSKLAAAYGLRLRPDKCKQMWISSRPRTGIRVDGQPIELVDEFCYLGCTLKNNGSYERDVQQRCAKATSAFNSLTKCLLSTPITNEVKLRVYLSAIRPIMMYGSETWTAPTTVMERLDCTERKLLRRLFGYFWPRVYHNEDLYAEIDVVYRRMTRGKHQHLAPPSKVAKVNRLRFFGHILRRPADRLVQRVLRSSLGSSWKKPPGRKRKFWTEAVKEDLRTLGVDRQFRRDKIEKVGQSCVQGRHTSAKMRVIASGDDISPPIKSSKSCSFWIGLGPTEQAREQEWERRMLLLATWPSKIRTSLSHALDDLRRYVLVDGKLRPPPKNCKKRKFGEEDADDEPPLFFKPLDGGIGVSSLLDGCERQTVDAEDGSPLHIKSEHGEESLLSRIGIRVQKTDDVDCNSSFYVKPEECDHSVARQVQLM
ncbi:hypothetical protein RB195_014083 [Necator americanus]|uniref:Reverse transcriptase domain-containing protein n=1 Tax=Necator americanus TaxID=51031 RepID=A0ABR1DYP6_NECAM